MGNVISVDTYKEELKKVLEENKDLLIELPKNKQKLFKDNFLEFCTNSYLMENIKDKKMILKLAIDLTKQGIDVNPYSSQVSIIPYKSGNDKVPQAIIHLKGKQEEYFQKGFLLKVVKVWKLEDGSVKREDEMGYAELAQIKETKEDYRDKHFVGWVVILEDLKQELPKQEKFVSYDYAKSVAKNKQVPKENELEGLVHSAVRHAERYFVIPQVRKPIFLDRLEKINIKILEETETINKIENKNSLKKEFADYLISQGIPKQAFKSFTDYLKMKAIDITDDEKKIELLNNKDYFNEMINDFLEVSIQG